MYICNIHVCVRMVMKSVARQKQTLSVHLLALEEVNQFSELLLITQHTLTLRYIQVVVRETNQ